jgi:hypothetical protein
MIYSQINYHGNQFDVWILKHEMYHFYWLNMISIYTYIFEISTADL